MGIDRVAVITGATGGLGRIVARRLAEEGARLALFSTNGERLTALARGLALPAERYLARPLDLSEPNAAESAASAVLERFGRAEILLHLVGGWIGGTPVIAAAADGVVQMLQQHLWTTFYLLRAFVPHLIANHWGRVIVISSPNASDPPEGSAPYAVGKASQEALMLALARELKGTGVTANILRVRTIDVEHERDRAPSAKNASWTTPEEITAAIVYLCSEEARTVNGARIPLHGAP